MTRETRRADWAAMQDGVFDVAIVGGGVSGACLFHALCSRGYRTLLVDRGDFAGGTSQASAMMVWGGLLYLRSLDVVNVWRLCRARDRLVRDRPEWVRPATFLYLPRRADRRNRALLRLVLYFYALLAGLHRPWPRYRAELSDLGFVKTEEFDGALAFDEARLLPSDSSFVLGWILPHRGPDRVGLNYCALQGSRYDAGGRRWHLDLRDSLDGREGVAAARVVVNTGGAWTDAVNRLVGIDSPYAHVLSKGVFIGLRRDPRHQVPLVFECGDDGQIDCMPFIPWGPISLWGPTETPAGDVEDGFLATPEDVRSLLDQLNRHLVTRVGAADVLSLRCGVRALAVERSVSNSRDSLRLSRRYRIHRDGRVPWITVYGGKLTNCVSLAASVTSVAEGIVARNPRPAPTPVVARPSPELTDFPGLTEKVPSARWCAENELCCTLEDYLRRRTNIAQWVARGGLGPTSEHAPHLARVAEAFVEDAKAAESAVRAYEVKVNREFDEVLRRCQGQGG